MSMGRGQTATVEDRFSAIFGERRGTGAQPAVAPIPSSGPFGSGARAPQRRLRFLHWWLEDYGGRAENVATLAFRFGESLESPHSLSKEKREWREDACRRDLAFFVERGICLTSGSVRKGRGLKHYWPAPADEWPQEMRYAYAVHCEIAALLARG